MKKVPVFTSRLQLSARRRCFVVSIVLITLLASLFVSCSKGAGKAEGAEEVEEEAAAEAPAEAPAEKAEAEETESVYVADSRTLSVGLVTYLAGDVYLRPAGGGNEDERPAVIGDEVEKGQSLRTASSSTCELQFGETAVVRVQEETVLRVDSILSQTGAPRVKLTDRQGTVAARVEKLAKGAQFSVKTQSVVCGVRGTEFVVTEVPDKETVLSVKEGEVAILPSSLDEKGLMKELSLDERTAEQVSKKVDEIAPVVRTRRKLVVPVEKMPDIEKKAKEIAGRIGEELSAKGKSAEEAEGLETYREVEEEVQTLFFGSGIEEADTDVDEAEGFEILETMRSLPISAEVEEQTFKEVSIAVSPAGASIFLNGSFSGKRRVDALFPPGESVTVEARLEGYLPQRRQITVSLDEDASFSFELEKKEEETSLAPEEASGDSGGEAPEPVDLSFTFSPKEVELSINGSSVPSAEISGGMYTGSFMPGETIRLLASAEGYNSKSTRITVGGSTAAAVPVHLTKTVADSFAGSSSAIVGRVVPFDGAGSLMVVTDRYGVVSGFNRGGELKWSVPTSNSPNENSPPVLVGGRVYFSGANEFLIIEAGSGEVLYQEMLQAGRKHSFGRRVSGYGDSVVYPTDDGLSILASRTGEEIGSIALPGGSRMSPAVEGSYAYVVDQEGMFLTVDLEAGEISGRIETSAVQPIATRVVADGDRAYFIGRNGTVVCVRPSAGELLWEHRLEEERNVVVTTDPETGGGSLYVFANGSIYGLSASDGSPLFRTVVGASGPPLYHGGRIIFGTANKEVEVRDARSAARISGKKLDTVVSTRPTLIGEKLYIGTRSGKIVTLNTKDWLE